MKYLINYNEVCKEEFEKQWEQAVEEVVKKNNSVTKEEWQEGLSENRCCLIGSQTFFIAVEEEIVDIMNIIEEHESDPFSHDSLCIAVALWKAGYRLKEELK